MGNETPKAFFKNFNLESFLASNRYREAASSAYVLIASLIGLILIGAGAFYVKSGGNLGGAKVEVLSTATEAQKTDLFVEVAGAVEKPGVYKLSAESRVDEALVLAGGLSADADREWVEKALNRAAKISDGQKIYIPKIGESSKSNISITSTAGTGGVVVSGLVNINTATLSELDKLPGIGPVYAQNIIEHRPYSTVEELVSKGALKQYIYEKIKDKVSVY